MSIRVALIGVGNCASSLVQGVGYYARDPGTYPERVPGLMHVMVGPYGPGDITFSAAFDVNRAKVGRDLGDAIFAQPNNTIKFHDPGQLGVIVSGGPAIDGIGDVAAQKVALNGHRTVDVVKVLKDTGTQVVVNYLPVGSEQATRFYAQAAIDAGCAFVNCIPVFLAQDKEWRMKFEHAGLPLLGDDIKSQLGATITHRLLTRLFEDRGIKLERTYQLNVGGNMDFYNMLEQSRLESKRTSKSNAVTSELKDPIDPANVHIGPSDYVEWLTDRKLALIRMEGTAFGGVPLRLDMQLEVWDSPNSAGVVIDAIRLAKLALDQGHQGAVIDASAWLFKSPPLQYHDDDALKLLEGYIEAAALAGVR